MQHFGGGAFHLSSAVAASLTIGVKYLKISNMIFEYYTASPPLPASDDLNNKMECSSAAEVFISLLQKGAASAQSFNIFQRQRQAENSKCIPRRSLVV